MKSSRICVVVLLSFAVVAANLQAQDSTQSLGELARRERERKKAQAEAVTQIAESPGVGIRLVIPAKWQAKDNPNPLNNQLLIDCAPEHSYGCSMNVESQVLPRNKAAIAEADRKEWDSIEHFPQGFRRVSSRDFVVADRPAYEVTFESPDQPRRRYIHVLARDGGRLYTFELGVNWDSKDHLDEYTPAVEKVLESLSPLGQPTPQQVERVELVAGFSPEERTAVGKTVFLLLIEQMCKGASGKYGSFDQLLGGCKGEGAEFRMQPDNDPRKDPNYEYRLTARSDSFEVSVIPRRAGLGFFFSDGAKIYYNPKGPGSNRDKVLWELSLPAQPAGPATASAPPAPEASKPAAKSKKVWTAEDLQGLRGTVNVAGGETSARPASGETPSGEETAPALGAYKPEEELALQYVCAFSVLEELECELSLKRFCTVEELARGVETWPGKIKGFAEGKDPRLDPNYEYRLTIRGKELEVSAIPRRPGLGGFFTDNISRRFRYNPRGEASIKDTPVKDSDVDWITLVR